MEFSITLSMNNNKKKSVILIFALKAKSCLNLMEYTYTISKTCVYKILVIHVYSAFKIY